MSFPNETRDLTPLYFVRTKCNGDNGLYVSSYYSTAATCQISEHEKLALEFDERSFHVFDSIGRSMFKYTFVSSRVPCQLHS
jgi:hypothetical protein